MKVTYSTSFYILRTTSSTCGVDIINTGYNKVRIDGAYVKKIKYK